MTASLASPGTVLRSAISRQRRSAAAIFCFAVEKASEQNRSAPAARAIARAYRACTTSSGVASRLRRRELRTGDAGIVDASVSVVTFDRCPSRRRRRCIGPSSCSVWSPRMRLGRHDERELRAPYWVSSSPFPPSIHRSRHGWSRDRPESRPRARTWCTDRATPGSASLHPPRFRVIILVLDLSLPWAVAASGVPRKNRSDFGPSR